MLFTMGELLFRVNRSHVDPLAQLPGPVADHGRLWSGRAVTSSRGSWLVWPASENCVMWAPSSERPGGIEHSRAVPGRVAGRAGPVDPHVEVRERAEALRGEQLPGAGGEGLIALGKRDGDEAPEAGGLVWVFPGQDVIPQFRWAIGPQ